MDYQFDTLRKELERRRSILIKYSHDNSFKMEAIERERIQSLLERGENIIRPADIPTLMKQFCVSAFSYSPLRRFLKQFVSDIPMRASIAKALSLAFDNEKFLDDANWCPDTLYNLAESIQRTVKYDLNRKQFKPRMIAVLLTGTSKLSEELNNGLEGFYNKISAITSSIEMWQFVNDFSKPIAQVGPALVCDFFKEIGFTQYVKVDHHFKKQFPQIVPNKDSCKSNPKQSFILSQEIASKVGITPFHLDAILYLWGRYADKIRD